MSEMESEPPVETTPEEVAAPDIPEHLRAVVGHIATHYGDMELARPASDAAEGDQDAASQAHKGTITEMAIQCPVARETTPVGFTELVRLGLEARLQQQAVQPDTPEN
jgi:hypothetical protein